MKNNIDISFIIPVFNTPEEQIIRCLNSFNVVKDLNIEILLIDDGSNPQNSALNKKIAQKYGARYLYEKNSGVSVARNLGLSKAVGEYVFFLDSDDEIKVSNISKSQLKNKTDIIIYDLLMIDSSIPQKLKFGLDSNFKHTFSSNEFFPYLLEDGIGNWAAGKLFRRQFMYNNKLRFDASLIEGEDIDLVYNALICKPTITYFDKIVYIYNISFMTGDNRKYSHPFEYLKGIFNVYKIRKRVINLVNIDNKDLIQKNICRITVNRIFLIYAYLISSKKKISNKDSRIINSYIKELKVNPNLDTRSKLQIYSMEHNCKGLIVGYYHLRAIIHSIRSIKNKK